MYGFPSGHDVNFAICVCGVTLLFSLGFYAFSPAVLGRFLGGNDGELRQAQAVIWGKALCGFFYVFGGIGVAFLLDFRLRHVGLEWGESGGGVGAKVGISVGLGAGVGIVAAVVGGIVFGGLAALGVRKPAMLARYPEIRLREWPKGMAVKSALAWAVYLAGYEFLFRGVLLMPLAVWFGPYTALALMTALYVLAHMHKPAGETLSCFVMGPVFGVLALSTQSVLGPWLMHTMIAVASETMARRLRARGA